MGKTACKNSNVMEKKEPKYECKKCGATVKKEKWVCKPGKITGLTLQ